MEGQCAPGYLISKVFGGRGNCSGAGVSHIRSRHGCHDSPSLFLFQSDVAAAALAIDAHQNFFVWFQFLAERDEVFRIFNRLLVRFLDHVAFAQAGLRGGRCRVELDDDGSLNFLWQIQRGAQVVG